MNINKTISETSVEFTILCKIMQRHEYSWKNMRRFISFKLRIKILDRYLTYVYHNTNNYDTVILFYDRRFNQETRNRLRSMYFHLENILLNGWRYMCFTSIDRKTKKYLKGKYDNLENELILPRELKLMKDLLEYESLNLF